MSNEYKMKQERRHFLNANETEKLTHEERSHGYHFCPDWDFMVVGPEDPEIEGCLCGRSSIQKKLRGL